jgi:flagellar hook-associated protein 1 FlgK
MSSISSIMNTAITALQAQQIRIDVVNSNIANANSDGYCRRTATVSEVQTYSSSSSGYMGTGVEVTDIKRVTDAYTLKQLCSAEQDSGKSSRELNYLEDVESVFNESDGSGLSDALSTFFNAWSDLANDPSGATQRSVVVSDAQQLASTLNEMDGNLQDIQNNIDSDIPQTVDDINGITSQIADLNQKILEAKNSGLDANTYLDERDSLLTELSSKVDIASYEDDSGQLNIQLSNGKSLVRGSTSYELGTEANATTGLSDITWADQNGNETVITDSISKGELGGELEVRDSVIPEYMDSLDKLASTIIEQVNDLHTTGYDANGDAGTSFFTGTGASDIAVNDAIVNDTNLVAAASVTIDGDNTTFQQYYDSLVSKIGTLVDNTTSSSENQSNQVSIYQNYRDSISGVSSDEELANLTLYQNAYEAAAKVISALDEMMQTLIDM